MELPVLRVIYTAKHGMRQNFLEAINDAGILYRSQKEEGCITYSYEIPPDSEDNVILIEVWQSDQAQKAHTETAHFKKLQEIKKEYIEITEIKHFLLREVNK